MQKRNFILLIIILVAILAVFFGFLFLRQGPALPGEDGGGTNFLSQFNPFGADSGKPDDTTPLPVDISGYEPPAEQEGREFFKVSSMPVAGYGVFKKERYKEVPIPPPDLPLTKGEEQGGGQKPAPPQTEFVAALRYVARTTGN